MGYETLTSVPTRIIHRFKVSHPLGHIIETLSQSTNNFVTKHQDLQLQQCEESGYIQDVPFSWQMHKAVTIDNMELFLHTFNKLEKGLISMETDCNKHREDFSILQKGANSTGQ